MFKKLSASLGIGSAKVDTILNDSSIFQGETLSGFINIVGGQVEQKIDSVILKLCTDCKIDTDSGTDYQNHILNSFEINRPFIIRPYETKDVPFELTLHNETPITTLNARINKCKVWAETALDIDFAINPSDRDHLDIRPLPSIQRIIDFLEQEGFFMHKADVEKGFINAEHFSSLSGCYQELEFQNSALFNRKEIELSFFLDGNVIHCLAEIDRILGGGKIYREFTLPRNASESDIEKALLPILHA